MAREFPRKWTLLISVALEDYRERVHWYIRHLSFVELLSHHAHLPPLSYGYLYFPTPAFPLLLKMTEVMTTTVALPLSLDDKISKNTVQEKVIDIDNLPSPSFDRSVDDLTLEEKLDILSGVNFTHTNGVPRLGVPPLKVIYQHMSLTLLY